MIRTPSQCGSCGGFKSRDHKCPVIIPMDKHKARVCECGSVSYHLLKSGEIECKACHRQFGRWEVELK